MKDDHILITDPYSVFPKVKTTVYVIPKAYEYNGTWYMEQTEEQQNVKEETK